MGPEDRLQSNVEFELSRLIEKEIHYHVKTEIEKKQLEAMEDFNGVGVFSTLDTLNYGYLDFENIKNFLFKFKQEIMKEDVNSIIRRWSDHPDGKISFREFSLGITPELAGLSPDAARTDFNSKAKQRLEEENAAKGYTQVNASEHKSLRSFRNISGQGQQSPMRQEFKQLNLRQQEDPETQYVLDMIQMGSPSKDKDNRQHSRSTLKAVKRKPVLHNDVRGEDQQFD